MDKELELAKMELELIQVAAARAALEFSIKQRNSEIKRIQDNIKIQLDKEADLKQKIQDFSR